MFHNGELMEDFYTLMDVVYMFEWDRVSANAVLSVVNDDDDDDDDTLYTWPSRQACTVVLMYCT